MTVTPGRGGVGFKSIIPLQVTEVRILLSFFAVQEHVCSLCSPLPGGSCPCVRMLSSPNSLLGTREDAVPAHIEILLPLKGKDLLSSEPPDVHLGHGNNFQDAYEAKRKPSPESFTGRRSNSGRNDERYLVTVSDPVTVSGPPDSYVQRVLPLSTKSEMILICLLHSGSLNS